MVKKKYYAISTEKKEIFVYKRHDVVFENRPNVDVISKFALKGIFSTNERGIRWQKKKRKRKFSSRNLVKNTKYKKNAQNIKNTQKYRKYAKYNNTKYRKYYISSILQISHKSYSYVFHTAITIKVRGINRQY